MPEPPSNDALVVALRKALAVIERLEHERSSYGEGIAIVGMSCRFPGANSIEEFWELLENGVDAIAEVPRCRWDSEAESNREAGAINHRLGGFLRSVDEFDPRFFGISPREASRMDPQQRLFLEVSWEALEHAGIAPDSLINSRSGVFVGIAENDYQQVTNARTMNGDSDLYDATGSGYSFVSGRLAHVLGLQGPNMAVDTACSSSLVAIHLAVTSLQRRECQLAIAGGVQLRLLAATSIALSKAEALSPDGRCKAFDASANGFGRSEGCGVIVLKRLSDALVNNDRIFAVIRGSAINHDGPASGFTVPNEQAQVELIQEALRRAGVTADEVGYVEAHGTGTLLGDPIEMGALATVFGKRSHPLAIGSVKTNIGHLEGAAGIAGIIKTAMIVHEGWIPAHLHFTKPNPHIPWTALPVVIPTRLISWQDAIRQPARRRTAGVSSFSMSGANAHVILSEPPPQNRENIPFERPAHLLAVSAVSDAALRALVERYRDFVLAQESSGQTLGIADVCYTANTGRSHFSHRLGVIAESSSTLVASLTDWLADSPSSKITAGIAPSYRPPPKIAFLFCEQWVQSMGTELAATQPTFRTLLEQCGALADERLEQSLIEVLDGAQLTGAAGQAALFALEYSMAQLWRMWGIEPDLLFGHGLGEYAAACVAGVFSLADAMRLVVERGRLLEAAESGSGAMAARSAFESSARQIRYDKPRVPIVSSLNGGLAGGAVCEPTYWIRHLDQPAHLARGLQTLSVQGMDAFLEIGPQLPAEHWEQVLEAEQTRLPRLPSSGRHHWPAMLATLAKLYVQGARVDWQSFDRDYIPARKKLALPTYPFQRETYPLRAAVSTASPAISPLLDRMIRSPRHHVTIFETELSLPRLPFLADHHVFDVMVSPAACQLAMVLQASEKLLGQPGCILSDVVFPSALTLAADSPRQVQVHFARAERSSGFEFQVLSFPQGAPIDEAEMLSHAVGTLFPVACEAAESVPLETVRKRCLNAIPPEKWFEAIASCHIALGPTFRRTKTIWGGKDEVLLELIPAAGNLSQPGLLPSLLDACLQATALQLFDSPDPPATRLPFAIREL
ncbi:MAG TPA: beta-ketoacyl synthase N-terminal-like domain-containing protein, partial [Chthoniobacterales bacterium]|nr:beta-ketoacyl synthase N-terminal-like domain-containing protein [Chthoniobacterales bacterium]